ncbi:hypothetical protein N9O40_00015 [Planktomarina sp.]|nr:hypothetical protein [Planktomarina sp.]
MKRLQPSWSGDLDASLHKAGLERCEKTHLVWSKIQRAKSTDDNRKRSLAKPITFQKLCGRFEQRLLTADQYPAPSYLSGFRSRTGRQNTTAFDAL